MTRTRHEGQAAFDFSAAVPVERTVVAQKPFVDATVSVSTVRSSCPCRMCSGPPPTMDADAYRGLIEWFTADIEQFKVKARMGPPADMAFWGELAQKAQVRIDEWKRKMEAM